ncbi:hypothetical protein QJQ45_015993 [Haematococcus lacustris]|nr:hypothetical protein QJQ45_015993 [Haematococcus lacustris]
MDAAVGSNQFGLDAQLFTRGTGEDRDRGGSMVQRHQEKLQEEKENLSILKLASLMPQLGAAVRVLALREAVYDVDTAVSVLKSFQTHNDEAVKSILQRRKKLNETESTAVAKAEAEAEAASSSDSSSSSGSGSDSSSSESSGDRKKRSKKSSKDRSSKKRGKNSKSSNSKDKRKKKKKHRQPDKEEKKSKGRGKKNKKTQRSKDAEETDSEDLDGALARPKSLTASDNFGRFGIIRETDSLAKRSEFTLWAMEVKKVNIELLGKNEERELFKDYMEDYNTGTLSHRKYYNAELYERQKAAKAAAKGKPVKATKTMVDDEREMRRLREEERQRQAEERLQQTMAELQGTDKAREMREQDLLRQQMQAAYKVGDTKTAQLIQKRLMTDDEKIAKGIIKRPKY